MKKTFAMKSLSHDSLRFFMQCKSCFLKIALALILSASFHLLGDAKNGQYTELADSSSLSVVLALVNNRRGRVIGGVPVDIDASKGKYFDYVEVTWAKVPRADYYEVYRRIKGSGKEWEMIKEVRNCENRQILDATALEGVEYEYQVRVVEFDKRTKKKISVELREDFGYRKTKSETLPKPSFVVSDILNGEVASIYWIATNKATSYRLQVLKGNSSYITPGNEETLPVTIDRLTHIALDVETKETSYHFVLPDTSENVVYYCRVSAENDLERSGFTELKLIRTLPEPIDASVPNYKELKRNSPENARRIDNLIANIPIDESREQTTENYVDLFGKCFPSQDKLIKLSTDPEIFINSSLDSRKNENLVIFTTKTQIMTIKIVDFLGQVVYQNGNLEAPAQECTIAWNGKFGNRKAPIGTYTYFISATSEDGKPVFLAGNAQLVE
jgi:hypothetical protein